MIIVCACGASFRDGSTSALDQLWAHRAAAHDDHTADLPRDNPDDRITGTPCIACGTVYGTVDRRGDAYGPWRSKGGRCRACFDVWQATRPGPKPPTPQKPKPIRRD